MRFKRLAGVLLFAALFVMPRSVVASSVTDTLILKTYFREGSTDIDLAYRNNAAELDSFESKIRELKAKSDVRIVSSTIDGSGSPTGSSVANKELASFRAISLYKTTRSWLEGIGVRTKVNDGDIGWSTLADMVKVSDVPYKEEVLDILYNTPVWVKKNGKVVGSKKLSLINLRDGVPYSYMEKNLFDACRWASVTIVYEHEGSGDEDGTSSTGTSGAAAGTAGAAGTGAAAGAGASTGTTGTGATSGQDTGASAGAKSGQDTGTNGTDGTGEPEKQAKNKRNEPGDQSHVDTTKTIAGIPEPMGDDDDNTKGKGKSGKDDGDYKTAPRPARTDEDKSSRKPAYVCFKNNLLVDLALVPNLSLEFHLGHNWTMGVTGYYSWWRSDKNHFCNEITGFELNVRKYMGRKAKEKPLTGHHLGIYGQMINYDVDWKFSNVGYQGAQWGDKFPGNWGVGIEYGYSVPVGRRFNLDFTIGGGYFETLCSTYHLNTTTHMGREELIETKQITWWGPTKAEITLVWLIGPGNYNKTKRSRK